MAISAERVCDFLASRGCSSLVELRQKSVRSLCSIDHITAPIYYEDFFCKYLLCNLPCVLSEWATAEWRSRLDWCHDGEISWDLLDTLFGNAVAPITDCNQQRSYEQEAKRDMKIKEFIRYMIEKNDQDILYLKDWHFTRDFPSYGAYTIPQYFTSDWLNEFWENRGDFYSDDDYRFVYVGSKGSWTPFHADVFRSFSWSANVCGRKRWILLAPGSEKQLEDRFGHLPFDLENCPESLNSIQKRFEIIQETGEILFVPSGWYHQVFNLEDTISINHNWINSCNVDICWSYIKSRLKEVEEELNEHKEMEDWNKHCQLILRADCGMDFIDFFNFLRVIATNRLNLLQSNEMAESSRQFQSISTDKDCDVSDQFKRISTNQIQPVDRLRELSDPDAENLNSDVRAQCSHLEHYHISVQNPELDELGCGNSDLAISCDEIKTNENSQLGLMDGTKYFDVLTVEHAVYDLIRIEALLQQEMDSELINECLDLNDERLSSSPVELLSMIKSGLFPFTDGLMSHFFPIFS